MSNPIMLSNTIRMSDNKIKAKDLVLTGKEFFESEDFVLRGVKVNFRYDGGKKTDVIDSISYYCVDPLTFNSVTFKVNTTKPVIEQDTIDKATDSIYINVPINEAIIKIYKLEFGIMSVSITVPYVKLSEN
ncbi:MAG TPA: hypothetical protein DC053_21450 [Lachnoclostridium sp.]|nr:hypothetical protein [Lachnoclostridium sp.]